ncbi:hypothetical protein CCUS01_12287 [Colletotrichum cuscutae]|uniref:Uncharacterized protein n=1 Tax=Colletotrichum cuscutae TaxID=1209917 RepID=A0AAI9TVM0_9PEZI|nr:hypothetical protein CCUS01_12287 [Colletotrichum cuscutae]
MEQSAGAVPEMLDSKAHNLMLGSLDRSTLAALLITLELTGCLIASTRQIWDTWVVPSSIQAAFKAMLVIGSYLRLNNMAEGIEMAKTTRAGMKRRKDQRQVYFAAFKLSRTNSFSDLRMLGLHNKQPELNLGCLIILPIESHIGNLADPGNSTLAIISANVGSKNVLPRMLFSINNLNIFKSDCITVFNSQNLLQVSKCVSPSSVEAEKRQLSAVGISLENLRGDDLNHSSSKNTSRLLFRYANYDVRSLTPSRHIAPIRVLSLCVQIRLPKVEKVDADRCKYRLDLSTSFFILSPCLVQQLVHFLSPWCMNCTVYLDSELSVPPKEICVPEKKGYAPNKPHVLNKPNYMNLHGCIGPSFNTLGIAWRLTRFVESLAF